MTDTERVQMMADMNWKPASTYWKEQADKKDAEIARLREALEAIAEIDDDGFTSDGHERCADIAKEALK